MKKLGLFMAAALTVAGCGSSNKEVRQDRTAVRSYAPAAGMERETADPAAPNATTPGGSAEIAPPTGTTTDMPGDRTYPPTATDANAATPGDTGMTSETPAPTGTATTNTKATTPGGAGATDTPNTHMPKETEPGMATEDDATTGDTGDHMDKKKSLKKGKKAKGSK